MTRNEKRKGSKDCGNSYIFLLENLRDPSTPAFRDKGQTVRSEKEMKELFTAAGLNIVDQEGPTELYGSHDEVMIWVLK